MHCSGGPMLPTRMQLRVTPLVLMGKLPDSGNKADTPTVELARCLLRLANLPNFALDRLSRYETNLWRQASRILLAFDALDRRKPQERRRSYCIGWQDLGGFERE
jgi:hypothetical protein